MADMLPAPPSSQTVLAHLAALLPALREDYGVRSLSVFGSYARGEQGEGSDLDLLVEFDEVPGLLGFARLQLDLGDRLGIPVDLFTRPMLKPRIAPSVEADLVAV